LSPVHFVGFSPDGTGVMAGKRTSARFADAFDVTLTRDALRQQKLENYRNWMAGKD